MSGENAIDRAARCRRTMRRAIAIVWLVLIGCGGPRRAPTEVRRPSACEGSDHAACQEEAIVQSLCLAEPDGAACEDLRARGLLPKPPPTPEELAGCYSAAGEAGPRDRAVICLAKDRVSSRLPGDRWDQVRIRRWRREDLVDRAVWVVETEDDHSSWLIASWVTPAPSPSPPKGQSRRPNSLWDRRLVLRLMDDTGRWDVELVRTLNVDAERSVATVPRVEDVCDVARTCIEAARRAVRARARPKPPSKEIEAEIEGEAPVVTPPLVTLHNCWDAHEATLASLDPTTPVPDACQGMPADPAD